MTGSRVACIVSGGQTGADRAALDVAVELGIAYGGWCPAGGWAEDHPDPPGLLAVYPDLRTTDDTDPALRTRLNVRDADATLIVNDDGVSSLGTDFTEEIARELSRPYLVVVGADTDVVRAWLGGLEDHVTLNVAGPRESEQPGVYEVTRRLLLEVLATS